MNNKYIIENKTIFDGSKILFRTSSSIISFLILSNGIVVLVENNEIVDEDRNVLCYTFEGNLKWRIQSPDKLHGTNYYTSIYMSEKNELQAYSKNGVEYTLNEEDGSIIKRELIK